MYAIEMKGITKCFPGVLANDQIDFCVKQQEIHCLLGENGTGKSTLMNILFGLYKADEGEVYIRGNKEVIKTPNDANRLKIGMVHQHFMLVSQMTVLENIILGSEKGGLLLDKKDNRSAVQHLLDEYGFQFDLDKKIVDLSIGERQRVEIVKTLYRGADIIILDEPTAVLTPQEVDDLLRVLHSLKADGKTIIFITHKLNETMEVADRVTVLRKGKNVLTIDKEKTNPKELANYMVGRAVNTIVASPAKEVGEVILSLENVRLLNKSDELVNLEVRAGEIVGIAGVEGNGQLELEEIITGTMKNKEGTVRFLGTDITGMSIQKRKELGIGYIPSDRHKRAMLSSFSIKDNMLLGYQDKKKFHKKGFLDEQAITAYSEAIAAQFNVKAPHVAYPIGNLSGGNQQKVILGREIGQNPKLIVAAQPIRGLDIGAIEFIHETLIRLRDEGKAILLISAELSEIQNLSNRIGVLYEGRINAIFENGKYERSEIGLFMAGVREEEVHEVVKK